MCQNHLHHSQKQNVATKYASNFCFVIISYETLKFLYWGTLSNTEKCESSVVYLCFRIISDSPISLMMPKHHGTKKKCYKKICLKLLFRHNILRASKRPPHHWKIVSFFIIAGLYLYHHLQFYVFLQ